ncbi:MAG: alpha/beta hydrolase [Actinomycetaceae bacterium]|nr:alpha/beta hydrolase [Actinomycetaceae bacterium]
MSANSCQFHLARMGEHHEHRPLVLLLHGFPEYWWAWRGQIEAIAAAGFEVAAVDTRGIAGSDKMPNSADGLTLGLDVAAIAQSLGASSAVVIGHGRGGEHAWASAALNPSVVRGVMTVSSPHPRKLQRVGLHVTLKTWRNVAATFLPHIAHRGLRDERVIRRILTHWSAPGNDGAASQSARYTEILRLPEAAQVAVDQLRWAYTSQQRPSGRKFFKMTSRPVPCPVWEVRGSLDPLLPARAWAHDAMLTTSEYRFVTIPEAGHFVPEEQPEAMNEVIIEFLQRFV